MFSIVSPGFETSRPLKQTKENLENRDSHVRHQIKGIQDFDIRRTCLLPLNPVLERLLYQTYSF